MLRADLAVLVTAGVLFAFRRARCTGGFAELDRLAQDFLIRSRSSRGERAHGIANIGAIEIQANALPQHLDTRLCDAGIGARNTHLRTREAFIHAVNERRAVIAFDVGMRGDHFLRVHLRHL